jgi:hypothetical protein
VVARTLNPVGGQAAGDFVIERDNFRFHFPTTCVLLSLLLTGILWCVRQLSR